MCVYWNRMFEYERVSDIIEFAIYNYIRAERTVHMYKSTYN